MTVQMADTSERVILTDAGRDCMELRERVAALEAELALRPLLSDAPIWRAAEIVLRAHGGELRSLLLLLALRQAGVRGVDGLDPGGVLRMSLGRHPEVFDAIQGRPGQQILWRLREAAQ